MALTKGSATTVASGVTTSQTTTGVAISSDYTTLGVAIVQVGTATTAATFKVQVSFDGGTTYYDHSPVVATGLTAQTYSWTVTLPIDATHVRIVFTAQAGGTSSTLSAQAGKAVA